MKKGKFQVKETVMKTTRSIMAAALTITLAGNPVVAEGDRVGTSPWGPEDEIGTLNMMTETSRLEILQRIDGGEIYDLGVDYFVGMPDCCSAAFGDPTFQIYMIHAPKRDASKSPISYTSEMISMNTHSGTHIDSLAHFGFHDKIWNNVSADDAFGERGWTKSTVDKLPPIIARGLLIDVAGAKGVDVLPDSYSITVEDLEQALDKQNSSIVDGDVVMVRTGQMNLWPDKSKLPLFKQSGLSLEAAKWLVEEKNVMLIGADNLGIESFPLQSPEQLCACPYLPSGGSGRLLYTDALSRRPC